MNNNKNLILTIVLSVGLLALHSFVMRRYFPPAPQSPNIQPTAQPSATAPAPVPTPVQASAQTPAQASGAVPSTVSPAVIDPKAVFTLENQTLALTWRKQDGALVQAVWKKDGTPFFPEQKRSSKKQQLMDFAGISGVANTFFDGEPQVVKQEGFARVNFSNAAGELLSYQVPDQGHVIQVDWNNAKGNRLVLVRRPASEDAAFGMKRVFSISDNAVESVEWINIIKDPWFGSRKDLPSANRYVGVDAGVEAEQRNFYFAAVWDTFGKAERDTAGGYQLPAAGTLSAKLYLGPQQGDYLAAFGKPCKKILDFGFFGVVAQVMFMVLLAIQSVIPNWGWAIVAFGILIRVALWPFNNKTTVQALRMKELEPHQKALQAKYEKFGNDMQKKAEMQRELMAFYKKNGHNPMGGCLPMLIQMPVFIALWSMLSAVFELRQAPWILWMQDLSQHDKFYVLPILLGVTMVIQQIQTPAAGDPAQRKMMMILMPAMMVFMFANFPAGLNLYYLAFNLVGMGQAWWVTKSYQPQPVVV